MRVFEDKARSVWAVIDSIICKISSWVLVKKEFINCSLNDLIRDWMSCISDSNGAIIAPIQKWNPPDIGKSKVNFDGASFGNLGSAAFSCVMRDFQGHIIGVKRRPVGVSDTIHAETIGFLEGFKLAKGKGIRDCIMEGDSLTVISWEREDSCGSWRMHHYIAEIKSLIKDLDAELHHVLRNQNSLADKIAKWSVGQSSMFERDSLSDC